MVVEEHWREGGWRGGWGLVLQLLGPPAASVWFSQQATVKVSVCFHRSDSWMVIHHPTISVTVQNCQFYNHAAVRQYLTSCAGVRQYAGLTKLFRCRVEWNALNDDECLWGKDWKCVSLWPYLNNSHFAVHDGTFSFVAAIYTHHMK